jgi:hypothetical protein
MKRKIIAVLSAVLFWAVCVYTTACSASTVAQDIVAWTPTLISTAQTVDSVVAGLDPANATLIIAVGQTFTAAATVVENQAKAYLANPSATALGQLQAQALAFQQQVNTALLNAFKVVNAASQKALALALNGAVTVITAILSLITTIKGTTLTPSAINANVATAKVMPLINQEQSIQLVMAHYKISHRQAQMAFNLSVQRLQAAGV